MATKSKLEQAVKNRAASLSDAQREIVLSQFSVYKANSARIAEIKSQMDTVNAWQTTTIAESKDKQSSRASLSYEYNQLATANSRIAADLFEFLKEEQ